MFANLKKKIESEVGDLSRLTPNLRSVTQSDKMTPLSSRHGSVSSLASETSYTNKLASPLSPIDSQQMFGGGRSDNGATSSGGGGAAGGGGGIGRVDNQRVRRQYEEKLQNQELDFAWRLNSKDEEITKLQKQVDHLNSMLQSKEFETQQKLVRVQEDMDSLEGFSQQENAKIKHLLLNREEELSQLRATVMLRDSTINEFESQVKNMKVENDRLKKSLDEIVSRRLDEHEERVKSLQIKLDNLSGVEKERESLAQRLSAAESENGKLVLQMNAVKVENERLQKYLDEVKISQSNEHENEHEERVKSLQNQLDKLSGVEKEKDNLFQKLSAATVENGKLVLQMDTVKAENEGLQKYVDEIKSNQSSEYEEQIRNLQSKLDGLTGVQEEKEALIQKLSAAEEKIQKLQKLEEVTTSLNSTVEEKTSMISTLENQIKVLQSEKVSALNSLKTENLAALEEERKVNAELRSKLDESAHVEVEKGELARQINHLKSENERLKRSLDETASRGSDEHEKQISSLQSQLDNLAKVEEEKETLIKKLSMAEEKIRSLQTLESAIEEKSLVISTLENQLKVLQEENASALESLKTRSLAALDEERKVNSELRSKLDESAQFEVKNTNLTRQVSEIQAKCDKLEDENKVLKSSANTGQLQLDALKQKVSELEASVLDRNQVLSAAEADKGKIVLQMNAVKLENEHLQKYIDEVKSSQSSEYEERVRNLQIKLDNLTGVQDEKENLVLKLSAAEEKIQNLQKLEDVTTLLSNALEEKSSIISTLENQIKVLQDERESALESIRTESLAALEEERIVSAELRSKLDESAHVEVENGELVLQISEIQSKCDELEEENNFLKTSANSDDLDALKRRVSELEADLLDRNQMLKQQSHQLQDLRRSLAKEINKNQAMSESASASSLDTVPQCNGSTSQQQQQQQQTVVSSCPSASEPPTLPPQETDVNFMYLRSVIFKFLTTTDVQVTQQLTRVVATLLHLSEEETHLLSQSTESRNGWISKVITKS